MFLPFENIFTSTELCVKFLFALILFPLFNNSAHNHPDKNKIAHYGWMIKPPRWLLAIMLLFPSKWLDYRVEIFCFISECVFALTVAVCAYLSLSGIVLPESIQEVLPRVLGYFCLFMVGVAVMIDAQLYEKRKR